MEWFAEERITLTFLATPLAEAALEVKLPRNLCLRAVLTGGDRLHRAPQRELPFRLMNHYGPTENTVVATYCEVQPYEEGIPPIGRAISNSCCSFIASPSPNSSAEVQVGCAHKLPAFGPPC